MIRLESEEGYKGNYKFEIDAAKSLITADYHYEDTSRFPARIEAVAIALCLEGFRGTFEISHDKGHLIIRQLQIAAGVTSFNADSFSGNRLAIKFRC